MEEKLNIKGEKTEKLTDQADRVEEKHKMPTHYHCSRLCLAESFDLKLFSHAVHCYPVYQLDNDVISDVTSYLQSYSSNQLCLSKAIHFRYTGYL